MSAQIIPFNPKDARCLQYEPPIAQDKAAPGLADLYEIAAIITGIQSTLAKQEQSAALGRQISIDHLDRAVDVLNQVTRNLAPEIKLLKEVTR